MKVSLTIHAQERARERRIGFDEIKACAAKGKEIYRTRDSKTLRFHKLCLIVNLQTDEIVTVFRVETDKRKAKARRKHQKKIKIHDKHQRKM